MTLYMLWLIITNTSTWIHGALFSFTHLETYELYRTGKLFHLCKTYNLMIVHSLLVYYCCLYQAQIGFGNVDNTSDINKPISTATLNALNNKVDKVSGKDLSTNDYTTTEKNKLAGIADNATKVIIDLALSSTSTNSVLNKIIKATLYEINIKLSWKIID